MATTKNVIPEKAFTLTLHDLSVSDTRWRYWSECRNVRFWYAVLLTMNIEPSVKNRTLLNKYFPDKYEAYREKLDILIRRSSTHKALKSVPNPREGKTSSGKYVQLTGVLKFAKECKWDDIAAFEAGLTSKKIVALDGTSVNISQEIALGETDDLPKGLRYTYVRYAALAHLIDLAITDRTKFESITRQFFPGGKTSNAALGRAVASTVAQIAKNLDCKVPSGYGKEKNAKEIALVKKVANESF